LSSIARGLDRVVVSLIFLGPIAWFCYKAKPIGPTNFAKPYRWGRFVTMLSGLWCFTTLGRAADFFNKGHYLLLVVPLVCTFMLGATCMLLSRRKRSSLPMFVATYLLILVNRLPVALGTGRSTSPGYPWIDIALGFVIIGTVVYLCRRWNLLESGEQLVPGLPKRGFDTRTGRSL
jgi:hypothetical protein